MQISVKADVDKAIRELGPELKNKVLRAASAALNRIATSVKAAAQKDIAERTGYTLTFVRREVAVSYTASRANLVAIVSVNRRRGGRVLNLIEVVKRSKRNMKAFRKRIKKGKNKGAYLYPGVEAMRHGRPSTFPTTFIIPGKNSSKMLVFSRKTTSRAGKGNLKFEPGPSVARAFNRKASISTLRQVVSTRWPIEFERALSVFIKA